MLFRYLNSFFSVLLLLMTLFWQIGCSEQQEPTPISDNIARTPTLSFSSLEHNFGEIWDVETKSCSFPFTNTGTGTLVFEKIQPGCGCTTTTLAKTTYASGESGIIDAVFKPNASGDLTKTVTVLSNDPEQKVIQLLLKASVKQFVQTKPRYIRLRKLPNGKVVSASLLTPAKSDFVFEDQINLKGPSAKYITMKLISAGENNPSHARRLVATLSPDAPWGDVQAFATVTGKSTSGSIDQKPHEIKLSILGAKYGEVEADNTVFSFMGVAPKSSFEKTIQLTSTTGKPFQILDSKVSMKVPHVTLDITPIESGYELTLLGDTGSYLGSLAGYVLVKTDVAGEETLKFRTAGMVRYKKLGEK
jgi:hypothetical protein